MYLVDECSNRFFFAETHLFCRRCPVKYCFEEAESTSTTELPQISTFAPVVITTSEKKPIIPLSTSKLCATFECGYKPPQPKPNHGNPGNLFFAFEGV